MTIFDALNLAGGIALFLYGMSIMGSGLEKVASGKMQTVLQKLISSPLLGVLLGTHIGTCFTPMLAAIGASKGAKRSAVIHLYFNLISTAFFMVVIYGAKALFGIPFRNALMTKGSIANLHTATSMIATLLLLPFSK